MITLNPAGVTLCDGKMIFQSANTDAKAREQTMAARILRAHSKTRAQGAEYSGEDRLKIRFDSLITHDITYVAILQTARASGLNAFSMPFVMTNCHNSLCAVGGTINEDDHMFGLSAARRYGGVYVPANLSVIHQYAREALCRCGHMILGSDSHTRYGALGTMGIGEGGPEIVKQLLGGDYDLSLPEVVLVYLEGAPRHGVGPHDVALALCKAVYSNGFVKNKVLEFVGPGTLNLSMDFRLGIDVMTTETACLSSIWETDQKVEAYYRLHGRPEAYEPLSPIDGAYYDASIHIDLSKVEPMVALPFHPSNALPLRALLDHPGDILREVEIEAKALFGNGPNGGEPLRLTNKIKNGALYVDQGIIGGCAGGLFDNISEAASILASGDIGSDRFSLSVYPASLPMQLALMEQGALTHLAAQGALIKPCFCGPCFGAGDVPAHGGLSIRHTTRNFPNREGSKPGEGQLSAVALMDARSIAATARNGGKLTSAVDIEYQTPAPMRFFDAGIYEKRVFYGFGRPDLSVALERGPNIADWPDIPVLGENLLLRLASSLQDAVTTTDELIPSGETSSFRSNPLRLAEYTLSRRDPGYVGRAKSAQALEAARARGEAPEEVLTALSKVGDASALLPVTQVGSFIYATCPGDGSAREQAASSQRVLGGAANVCRAYATKRYRSNCINWGILPFTIEKDVPFEYKVGEWLFIPGIRKAVADGAETMDARMITEAGVETIALGLRDLDARAREILLNGCLINDYAKQSEKEAQMKD